MPFLTCIFIEPLQASFTGKCLLLADLWRFMFSENTEDKKKRLATSSVNKHSTDLIWRGFSFSCFPHLQNAHIPLLKAAVTEQCCAAGRHWLLGMLLRWLLEKILNKGLSHLSWRLFLADMSSPAEGLLFFLGGMALEQQAGDRGWGQNKN